MLRELAIRNLAVVESARVPFAPGLNVVTGETGAGKSIVVDALLLISGGRPHPDLIRSGEDTATLEAVFDIEAQGAAAAILAEAGLTGGDGQLVIRREISRSGRHRVWVNDSAATVGLLERLGEHLVQLHGQHEHQRLLQPAHQLALLDRFAGAEAVRERVAALVRRWEAARASRDRVGRELAEAVRQEDIHRFQLSEIDAARLAPGEEEALRAERQRLGHAERIRAGLEEAAAHLMDDGQSASVRLGRALTHLRGVSRLDAAAQAAVESLEAILAQLDDVVAGVRALRDRAEADPGRLGEIDTRLDAIARLKRKYGESEAAILAHREEISSALQRIERGDAALADLDHEVAAAAREALAAAAELSALREDGADRLARALQREVRGLGMAQCRVRVSLTRDAAGGGDLGGPWRIGPRGAEGVELLISANPGEDLRPLARVISGGELSRTMLAIRALLASADEVPTLVFDEVDAGIGGRVADTVGAKLARIAADRQVLCVTHLAPIAARAAQHLHVDKAVTRDSTRASIVTLDGPARVEELARMLGGERLGETSRRHARELLRGAQGAR